MVDERIERDEHVVTSSGKRYQLGRRLGSGGQGAVFSIEGASLAVKLLHDKSTPARERLRQQLKNVDRLPLHSLDLARPIDQLRPPHVGYVMELFTGMVPLQSMLRPPKDKSSVQWYIEGGGLRRRLRLLARTADILAELHGRGLVYVDPSPNNVFVSKGVEETEVRLIDVDNLRTLASPGRTVSTPGYGAPEIVERIGVASSLSDAYAFAVLAFEVLVLVHPFLGDRVQEGEPALEEKAFAGLLPWIEEPGDDSNRSRHGIPREIALSPSLRADFQQTFGEGRSIVAQRPGVARLAEHLHRAADRTLVCPECSCTYYFVDETCPRCERARPSFVMAVILLWDPERIRYREHGEIEQVPGLVRLSNGQRYIADALTLSRNRPVILSDRLTHGTTSATSRVKVEFTGEKVKLETINQTRWRLVYLDDRFGRALTERPIELPVETTRITWQIHAGAKDRLHRVIRFRLYPQGSR